ncbi:hypothetical protein TL16_g08892 [Triparma laevis f. inornata]|uniref:Acyltransferase 3 domain-containing protein n=1 Tax=Triparma laevis f. inornata TaxID=1714386 RepID=A0A9W7EJI9_9STRA|nr:hypothetical protein TL16_g08892 [Triparma laevis f. inornata]
MACLTVPLSKPTSKKLFFSILSILVAAQCAVPGIMIYIGCVLILLWITFNTVIFMCRKPSDDFTDPSPLLPTTDKPASSSAKSERFYYLDNLKIFLTLIVIMHHQTCSFVGTGWYFNIGNYNSSFRAFGNPILAMNQSYFMCVFFFISGYFTPSSFEKKGRQLFLRDKFKRLGIPYILFAFVLSLVLGMIYKGFCGHDISPDPTPNPGPLWFVGWLLVFNYAYSCTDHNTHPTIMGCPSPFQMLKWTFWLNILQFGLIFAMGGTFAYMPLTLGSLPFDVMYFYGGCIAKRNKWLETGTEGGIVEIMDKHRKWIYAVIAIHAVYNFGYNIYYQQAHVGEDYDLQKNAFYMATCIFLGTWLYIAYTAYIIHPFFVVTATGVFVKTYEAATGQMLVFEDGKTDSETVLESDVWLWGGWAVCSCTSVFMTFFVSYWFRELMPGAKQIL